MAGRIKVVGLLGGVVLALHASGRANASGAAAAGILASAGFTAASGRTTLGAGAGVTEAGILSDAAMQQAGAIIAGIAEQGRTDTQNKKHPVLLLAHDEKLDLISPELIRKRLDQLNSNVTNACKAPNPAAPPPRKTITIGGETFYSAGVDSIGKPGFLGSSPVTSSDLATIGMTEQAVGGIVLSADDRLLVNAIAMSNTNAPAPENKPGWNVVSEHVLAAPVLSPAFRIPGEVTAAQAGSATLRSYNALVATLDSEHGKCTSTAGKAEIEIADKYIVTINTGSDKGAAPLLAALQTEAAVADRPYVLRVAVEQVGGTSIARAGFIYALGFPNAATVGAGLKASFRMIDPYTPSLIAVGEVRCAVGQTNIKRLPKVVNGSADKTVCAYRVAFKPPVTNTPAPN